MWYTEQYGKKKKIEEKIKSVLDRFANEPDDMPFLMQVLSHHPNWATKSVDLDHILVRPNRQIWLIKRDRTEEDISWKKCLIDGIASARRDIFDALRWAVTKQNSALCSDDSICELCSMPISEDDVVHKDHVVRFEHLVDEWAKEKDIQVRSKGTRHEIVDEDLLHSWCEYHKTHASLRKTHARCNMKRKRD